MKVWKLDFYYDDFKVWTMEWRQLEELKSELKTLLNKNKSWHVSNNYLQKPSSR